MSYEEAILQKHKFEHQIRNYLKECRRCDRQELELVMARLLDAIQASTDPHVIIDAKFKGSLTKMVFNERLGGQKKLFGSFFVGVHWSVLPKWRFDYPLPMNASTLDEITKKYSNGMRLHGNQSESD